MRVFTLAILCALLFVRPIIAQEAKHTNKPHKKLPPVLVQPQPGFDLQEYVLKNLRYPESAKEASVHGRVMVQFWIDEQGSVTDVRVVRGIGGGCDEEAKRVVKGMPAWKPGTYNGKPTKMRYTLPVNFKIE